MKEELDNKLHDLKLEKGQITLDNFYFKGLIGYSIDKNSAASPTELSIKLLVND